jgi:hypothetical protein
VVQVCAGELGLDEHAVSGPAMGHGNSVPALGAAAARGNHDFELVLTHTGELFGAHRDAFSTRCASVDPSSTRQTSWVRRSQRAPRCPGSHRDGEELPGPGDALELVRAVIVELQL